MAGGSCEDCEDDVATRKGSEFLVNFHNNTLENHVSTWQPSFPATDRASFGECLLLVSQLYHNMCNPVSQSCTCTEECTEVCYGGSERLGLVSSTGNLRCAG